MPTPIRIGRLPYKTACSLGVQQAGLPRAQCVAVVPVRETEAWTLADADALRAVFGSTLDDSALGLSARGRAPERVTDPKQMLEAGFVAAQGGGRRRRGGVGEVLNALGERVALQCLRDLPSFVQLETDLCAAMKRLQILT